MDSEQDMRVVREVWERDRYFTFPKFRETSEYLVGEMKRRGVADARVLAAPADGKTQYGYWTMPLAWDVRSARLTLADGTVLADYAAVPASVGMWSGPTPAGGLEAEIVHGKDADWRGKLVLTDANPAGLKAELVKRGALGAINGFSENRALRNDRQWVNAWGDKGWGFLKGDTPLLCFSITPAQVEDLKARLAKGPVRARAVVDTRLYEGEYAYMTALVPGTTSAEVLTLGHIAEQGAHDNATGVAVMAGALGTLQRLIAQGKLANPRRGIRMLAMGELYGTMHWLATTPTKPVAAMTLDTPAGSYEMPGTAYDFYLNPHVAASYTDALVLAVAEAHLSRLSPPRAFGWKAFMPGTDSFLSEPLIGIDTVWPYSGTGVHSHHNSADRPETVDARSLRDLTVITAAYLYAVASAGDAELPWLAGLTAARYEGLLAQAATVDWVKAADLGVALYEAQAQIRYREDRGLAAVDSLRKLGKGDLAAAQARVRKAASAALAAVQSNANLASRMMGRGAAVTAMAPAADPRMADAAKIVVRRKRMGSMTLDDLPQAQWEGWPSGAWGTREQLALFWCDGKRTLAEVIRLTKLEAGATKFDFVGYFRFLEKHGYVEFAK
ncbi:MAG: hypothetical protein IT162_15695 [Bryobacterales bacterium]|nr:hypothetical protein [Bryobacterales bacterium]